MFGLKKKQSHSPGRTSTVGSGSNSESIRIGELEVPTPADPRRSPLFSSLAWTKRARLGLGGGASAAVRDLRGAAFALGFGASLWISDTI
jgi:hypothetical protein